MPFGGIDVGDYIEKLSTNKHLDYKKLLHINNALLNLFKNGVLLMNHENIYHCDLKESNILIDDENNLRVIDWGISCKYDGGSSVPEVLDRRTFQYNIPFSNILFSNDFYKAYKKFLNGEKEKTNLEIREFVIEFIFFWVKVRGPGHLKGINNIITLLFEENMSNIDEELKDQIIEFNYTFNFIIEYITKILMKFTKNSEFDKISYLKIFLKNVDVWGFAICYMAIFEVIKESKKMTKNKEKILEKIKEAILLLYESSDIEIDINKLINILEDLNPIFRSLISEQYNRSSTKTTGKTLSSMSSSSFLSKSKTSVREKEYFNKSAKGLRKKKNKEKNTRKRRFSLIRALYKMRGKK
jgi:serine/threonine protein kinase